MGPAPRACGVKGSPGSFQCWDVGHGRSFPEEPGGRPSSLAFTAQGKPRLDCSTPELTSMPSPCPPSTMARSPEGSEQGDMNTALGGQAC